ncbi:pentapeptide MXKDX repeat protein [Modicisalibacter muralis]|uniref:Pentapeptide MXKDX repeat protein n=1 Tax=Modicisalibacter muralis TaxID=119000 RepID=A0A1G9PU28_9GAMM|nr:pentapeptide MXKDX repeat protein [Halomonas muralis]SDM02270.1 pentapeptide MXKDX repeat protein [Halomonas muralis]
MKRFLDQPRNVLLAALLGAFLAIPGIALAMSHDETMSQEDSMSSDMQHDDAMGKDKMGDDNMQHDAMGGDDMKHDTMSGDDKEHDALDEELESSDEEIMMEEDDTM